MNRLTRAALCLLVAAPAWANTVRLAATDGAPLVVEHQGEGTVGVVLVHSSTSDSAQLSSLGERLSKRGLQVVSVQLRPLTDDTLAPASADVLAALAWLEKQGATSLAIVGEEDGGNLALHSALSSPKVRTVVILSPRVRAPGLSLSSDLAAYGERSLLLVVGAQDPAGVRTAGAIDAKALGHHAIAVSERGRTGPSLITDDPQVEGRVVAWLHDGGPPVTEAIPAAQLKTGDVGTIETTGTRFGR